MASVLRKHWFLTALGLAVAGGLLWPEGGAQLRSRSGLLTLLTAVSLFLSGLSLDTARLSGIAEVRGVLIGLSATYVVAPVLAYGLALVCGPPGHAIAGSDGYLFLESMMILAAQAGTIASAPAMTLIAGGNQALALLITVCSHSLTSLLTPVILALSIGAIVDLPVGEMMVRVATVVLLPVVLAQLLRRRLRGVFLALIPRAVRVSQLIILVFVFTGVSAASGALAGRPELILRFAGAVSLLHLALLWWTDRGARLAGLSTDRRAAVVLCGSQKTLPNGIYLWGTFFAQNPYGAVALVQYHLLQLVLDTLLIPWLEEKSLADVIAVSEEIVDGA